MSERSSVCDVLLTQGEAFPKTCNTSKDLSTALEPSHSEDIPHETRIHYWAKVALPTSSTSGYKHPQHELELPEHFAWILKKEKRKKMEEVQAILILFNND